jgi:hypothetical protein
MGRKASSLVSAHVGWVVLLIVALAFASEYFLSPSRARRAWEGMSNRREHAELTEAANMAAEAEGEAVLDEMLGSPPGPTPTPTPTMPSVDDDGGGSKHTSGCPDMLIHEGGAYYLLNTRKMRVPGVNPVRLNSLEEYKEFVEWQRMSGISCPILYVQHMLSVDGSSVYRSGVDPLVQKKGYVPSIIQTVPQDVQMRNESMIRFSRNYLDMCGEGSVVHPQFCEAKEDYDAINRSVPGGAGSGARHRVQSDGRYRTTLEGVVPHADGGVYSYDPMNQYVGVRTAVDRY